MDVIQLLTDRSEGVSADGRPSARIEVGDKDFVVYGAYEDRAVGRYSAEFCLTAEAGDGVVGDPIVAIVQVVCNRGRHVLSEQRVLLSHLSRGLSRIVLKFALHEPREVEYRVLSTGQVALIASKEVIVCDLRQSVHAPSATAQNRIWKNEREFLDGYLRNVTGLIHVGANTGQERRYYWLLGLDVVWVEAIREVYDELVDNVAIYDRQRPVNVLLADVDGRTFDFKIANNKGASSSVLDLQDHATIFPGIEYVETRTLTSVTLETMMLREGLSPTNYQALTLDAEGAELMILKGAQRVLQGFQYIKCEVADFPARTGTPTVAELDAVLREAGFAQLIRRSFALGPDNRGTYWDIVWKRIESGVPLNEVGLPLPFVAHPQDVEGIEKLPG